MITADHQQVMLAIIGLGTRDGLTIVKTFMAETGTGMSKAYLVLETLIDSGKVLREFIAPVYVYTLA